MSISFNLKAKNSSGTQHLECGISEDGNELDLTLWGLYNGDDIQIDFEALNKSEVSELIDLLQSRQKRMKL